MPASRQASPAWRHHRVQPRGVDRLGVLAVVEHEDVGGQRHQLPGEQERHRRWRRGAPAPWPRRRRDRRRAPPRAARVVRSRRSRPEWRWRRRARGRSPPSGSMRQLEAAERDEPRDRRDVHACAEQAGHADHAAASARRRPARPKSEADISGGGRSRREGPRGAPSARAGSPGSRRPPARPRRRHPPRRTSRGRCRRHAPQSPAAMTILGSGVASHVRRSASAMFRVTGPVTSRQSAWRGEATKCRPKRSRS